VRVFYLNPNIWVSADPTLVIKLYANGEEFAEPINSPDQLDAIFLLASMSVDEFEDYLKLISVQLPTSESVLSILLSSHILVSSTDSDIAAEMHEGLGFAISSIRSMRNAVDHASHQTRDILDIFDDFLPEEVRFSLDVWVRQLPYRKIDVDRTDVSDLHWIYSMQPATTFVRALPFLRVMDDFIKQNFLTNSHSVLRTYIYSGSFSDIYHTHVDYCDPDDVTAIYYPSRWLDHWGGELLFYDGGEPRWVVAPRTGRLIIFRGSREHRVAPISFAAENARYSIVLRYGFPRA
jgi:hypothetical protein